MNNIVLYCKSYSRDIDRVIALIDSVKKYNVDNIPMFISVPSSDLSLFKNRMLNKIVFAAVLIGFCMSLNGALYLIWMEVVIELPEYSSRLMLAYYVVSVFGLWVWRKLGINTSKHFAAGIACLYAIGVLLIGFFGYV